jgi:hypothetical protein
MPPGLGLADGVVRRLYLANDRGHYVTMWDLRNMGRSKAGYFAKASR